VNRFLPPNTHLADASLRSQLGAYLAPAALEWIEPQLVEMGRAAAAELREWGDECERNPAWLRPVDPWGERVDEVVYPEAWRRLGAYAARAGLAGMPYEADAAAVAGPEVRVAHAALCYLFQPGTATYSCPIAMTDAAARVLIDHGSEELRDSVVPHLISRDPEEAWTAGQWMTEQQGGSDVGANAVVARREEGGWRLYGRKYFCSNVGGEVVLALARPEGAVAGTRGLGLFLIRRRLADGRRNHYRIDRLKDKLGTRAMATAEVTLEGAHAEVVGELDSGFRQMTPMLNVTRLHNAIASAAGMRRGLMLARAYASDRAAFGRRIELQPLHRQVLIEMAVDADAALALTMRVAQLTGRVEAGVAADEERLLFRLGTLLAKLYTGKRAVSLASEAIECFGGNGYMEDTGIARLLRDAQVLPIWEGTTSVLSLDVVKLLARPGVPAAFDAELERLGSRAADRVMNQVAGLAALGPEVAQRHARRTAYAMVEAWIQALLEQAATRGRRESAVAELWQARSEPGVGEDDRFELIVDGSLEAQPVGT
jgi:alkylation response protein AidB-like acyl-CoA dehydrogenase